MAGTINHRFVNPVPDEGVTTETGPNEWNDSLVIAGGFDSDVMVRRTSATDGWELIKLGASPAWVNVTAVSNSGVVETDFHLYTIPAAHFNVNKRAIRYKGWGSFAANANAKTLRLRFGTLTLITLNPTQTAPNGLKFEVEITIIRTASNAQLVFIKVLIGTAVELLSTTVTGEGDTATLSLRITGQSAIAGGDITQSGSMIEYLG